MLTVAKGTSGCDCAVGGECVVKETVVDEAQVTGDGGELWGTVSAAVRDTHTHTHTHSKVGTCTCMYIRTTQWVYMYVCVRPFKLTYPFVGDVLVTPSMVKTLHKHNHTRDVLINKGDTSFKTNSSSLCSQAV